MGDGGSWVTVEVSAEDLPPGSLQPASAGGVDLALARLADGSLAAFDLWCTHEECPLADGDLEGEHVVCYCHSGEFDVRTGAVVKGPPEDPVRIYPVREAAGEIQVRVEPAGG